MLNLWRTIFLFIDKFAFREAVILPKRTICKNVLIFIEKSLSVLSFKSEKKSPVNWKRMPYIVNLQKRLITKT